MDDKIKIAIAICLLCIGTYAAIRIHKHTQAKKEARLSQPEIVTRGGIRGKIITRPDGTTIFRPEANAEAEAEFQKKWQAQQAKELSRQIKSGELSVEQPPPSPPQEATLRDIVRELRALREELARLRKAVEESKR